MCLRRTNQQRQAELELWDGRNGAPANFIFRDERLSVSVILIWTSQKVAECVTNASISVRLPLCGNHSHHPSTVPLRAKDISLALQEREWVLFLARKSFWDRHSSAHEFLFFVTARANPLASPVSHRRLPVHYLLCTQCENRTSSLAERTAADGTKEISHGLERNSIHGPFFRRTISIFDCPADDRFVGAVHLLISFTISHLADKIAARMLGQLQVRLPQHQTARRRQHRRSLFAVAPSAAQQPPQQQQHGAVRRLVLLRHGQAVDEKSVVVRKAAEHER